MLICHLNAGSIIQISANRVQKVLCASILVLSASKLHPFKPDSYKEQYILEYPGQRSRVSWSLFGLVPLRVSGRC